MTDPRALPVPPLWSPAISEWRDWLTTAGRAISTIRTRVDHIQRLARALSGCPKKVDVNTLTKWLASRSWSRETRRSVHASLRSFFAWIGRSDIQLSAVSPAEPRPRPAPDDVLDMGLKQADSRTKLILKLGAYVGLRRVEIASIHRSRLRRVGDRAWLRVIGKGDRERSVPLPADLAAAIEAVDGFLFPGNVDGHLSPRWVGKLATRALPGEWTLHTLRHRFATRAARRSGDIQAVSQLLGHRSVATTQRYVLVEDDELARVAALAA